MQYGSLLETGARYSESPAEGLPETAEGLRTQPLKAGKEQELTLVEHVSYTNNFTEVVSIICLRFIGV